MYTPVDTLKHGNVLGIARIVVRSLHPNIEYTTNKPGLVVDLFTFRALDYMPLPVLDLSTGIGHHYQPSLTTVLYGYTQCANVRMSNAGRRPRWSAVVR